ncbi:MAG: hypothetical protein ACOX9R_11090 [Armatimonadota bacterium]|jgi:outer membrane protein assembly factor BamB
MLSSLSSTLTPIAVTICALMLTTGLAGAQELPEGVVDHGIAAPVGMPAWGGVVAYEEADGGNTVFIKLWAGGNTTYLFVDAETGETEQISPGIGGIGAYLVHHSPEHNAIYDTMGTSFIEIDLATREIRRVGEIPRGMALSFTSDDDGVIYGGIFSSATIVAYDPTSGEFTNHGAVNEEGWNQYLRPIAVDSEGWIYGGIGQAEAQVAGLNLATGETRQYISQDQRQNGQGNVWRGTDGNVYATAPGWSWHRLSGGEATAIEEPTAERVSVDSLLFPDGSRLVSNMRVDVPNRVLRIREAGADEPRELSFDYDSPGLGIYSMVAGPDGKVYGATGLPLRIWQFDPETGEMQDGGLGSHGGHVNQWVRQGDLLYGAVYSSGSLIEYDPSQPYDDSQIEESTNPRHLHGGGEARDLYGRPAAMLAHPDGRHVIIGGNAARVYVGGGMVIYDTVGGEETVLGRDDLIADQGINSMAALPNGDLIVGTTISAPTAGETVATDAMIYRIDWETKTLTERWTIEPRTAAVRDLIVPEDGLVYGLTSDNRLFVFDPENGEFVHEETVGDYGPVTGGQAPRTMAIGPDGGIYVLFRDAIARIEPGTFEHREVVRPGRAISAGVTIADGRLYFASGPRLLSYDLGMVEQ